MDIESIKDKNAYKRGRDSAEHLIKHHGYKAAKQLIEACITTDEYGDFDRGAESVIRERSVRP